MADPYCVRADLYKYAFPRGLIANPARRCASVNASANTFELDGHGLETDDAIVFRVEGNGSLPSPIVAGTTYRAIRVSESLFQAAATVGGAAIDLTTSGTSVMVATPLPFDDVIEFYSRWADGFMPANAVPFGRERPVPVVVKGLVAELSAKKLLQMSGQSSQSVDAMELSAKAQLERYAKGIPVRDANATASTDKAYSESVSADPRRWGPGGTLP
jgi:hypothetical protein